jgi:hypothetical protein
MIDFFCQNWGNIASVLGVFFSFLAFRFSKRASKAALAARNAAQSRSLVQDMNTLDREARNLISDINADHGERAVERATDMIAQLAYIGSRWQDLLVGGDELAIARGQLESIYDVLITSKGNVTARDKAELLKTARRVSQLFGSVHGLAEKASDFTSESSK